MSVPFFHGVDKFVYIPFRIPYAGVRIGEQAFCFRILVIKNSINHPGIKQQSFYPGTFPEGAFIGWPAIDKKVFSLNGYNSIPLAKGKRSDQQEDDNT